MSWRILSCVVLTAALSAQAADRPPIVGVAHIGLKASNLDDLRKFYGKGGLGFAEPFTLDKPGGGLALIYFKVNDHQYIEVSPDLANPTDDKLANIAFETTDARKLRDYLAERGVKVPDALRPGPDGNLTLTIQDPDGHNVQFVQYLPGSLHGKNFGKFMDGGRISDRIIHVGVTVKDPAEFDKLFKDILGFRLMWYGGGRDDRKDWIDMRVPEGTDWLEYMCNGNNPTPRTLGVMHHLALGVPSVEAGFKTLQERSFDVKNEKPKIGRDGKWQLNLYDAGLTRTELMEPAPVQTPCCSEFIK
jgi:catechol 2,3-dioxygenase-like lactoylglutathione lyase family enzyme